MNQQTDIQALLDRYWEGETTLDEERRLKAFFSAGNIPEAYRPLAPFFLALQAEQTVQLPAREQTITRYRAVRWYWPAAAAIAAVLLTAGAWCWTNRAEERAAPVRVASVPAERPIAENSPAELARPEGAAPEIAEAKLPERRALKPRPRTAPALKQVPQAAQEDTFEDPEAALAEIKAALALVSSKINKSKQTLEKGLQEVDHVDILLKKKKETNG